MEPPRRRRIIHVLENIQRDLNAAMDKPDLDALQEAVEVVISRLTATIEYEKAKPIRAAEKKNKEAQ